MNNFYIVGSFLESRGCALKPVDPFNAREVNLLCFDVEKYAQQKIEFLLKGSKKRDVLQWSSCWFIGPKALIALAQAKISGWSSFPVHIRNKCSEDIGYSGFTVTGKASVARSTYDVIHGVSLGFEIDSWDGNDFFVPAGTQHVLATEKVLECCRRYKINGWCFYPINPAGTLLDGRAMYAHALANQKDLLGLK